jgi:hypothetical protein
LNDEDGEVAALVARSIVALIITRPRAWAYRGREDE